MRFARAFSCAVLLLVLGAGLHAQNHVNPHNQINWPAGCQLYNAQTNSCVAAVGGGLPATGGTLTGPLGGTTGAFTGALSAAAVHAAISPMIDPQNQVYAGGALCNTRIVTDGAMSLSSNTLTSATANFTSADIGRIVIVSWAGSTVPGGAPLTGTIFGVTNSTTATLSGPALQAVTGARVFIGSSDQTAFNAAIAAAAALSPSGTTGLYNTASTIVLPPAICMASITLPDSWNPISVVGQGEGSSWLVAPPGNPGYVLGFSTQLNYTFAPRVANLTLSGGYTAQWGYKSSGAKEPQLQNLTVRHLLPQTSGSAAYYLGAHGAPTGFTETKIANISAQFESTDYQNFALMHATACAIAGNTATITAPNSLTVGMTVSGFSFATAACKPLNGVLLSVISTGLSSTQFEGTLVANSIYPTSGWNLPNTGTTADTGTYVTNLYPDYCVQTDPAGGYSDTTVFNLLCNNAKIAGFVDSGPENRWYSVHTYSYPNLGSSPQPVNQHQYCGIINHSTHVQDMECDSTGLAGVSLQYGTYNYSTGSAVIGSSFFSPANPLTVVLQSNGDNDVALVGNDWVDYQAHGNALTDFGLTATQVGLATLGNLGFSGSAARTNSNQVWDSFWTYGRTGYGAADFVATMNSPRWSWGKDASTESGSNAGSNFNLCRYADGAAVNAPPIDCPLIIQRNSGLYVFNHAADSTFEMDIDAGLTADQTSQMVWKTYGGATAEFTMQKQSANNFAMNLNNTAGFLYFQYGGVTSADLNGSNGQWYFLKNIQIGSTGTAIGAFNKGYATLSSGTATVSTTAACTASATCSYQVNNCGVSGTAGFLTLGTVTPGTSFVVNSSNAADNSKVCWQINN